MPPISNECLLVDVRSSVDKSIHRQWYWTLQVYIHVFSVQCTDRIMWVSGWILGYAKLCWQRMRCMRGRRPSYRYTDERWTEQMAHVMGRYACSTVAIVHAKSLGEINPLFDLSVVSDRTLAQQKAKKSKNEVTQCWNTLLKVSGVPTLISYTTAVVRANDRWRHHCRLSSQTDNMVACLACIACIV